MKRRYAIAIVGSLILLIGAVLALAAAPQPVRFAPAKPVAMPTPAPVPDAEVDDVGAPRALNFIERRRYRLTIRKLKPLVEEVLAEGEVDKNDTTAFAAAVLAKHIQDTPALQEDPGLDWDSLLEFIERLLPLILRIISIFS